MVETLIYDHVDIASGFKFIGVMFIVHCSESPSRNHINEGSDLVQAARDVSSSAKQLQQKHDISECLFLEVDEIGGTYNTNTIFSNS